MSTVPFAFSVRNWEIRTPVFSAENAVVPRSGLHFLAALVSFLAILGLLLFSATLLSGYGFLFGLLGILFGTLALFAHRELFGVVRNTATYARVHIEKYALHLYQGPSIPWTLSRAHRQENGHFYLELNTGEVLILRHASKRLTEALLNHRASFQNNSVVRERGPLMKVVIAGGSGQVGQILRGHFAQKATTEVVVLSRTERADSQSNERFVTWEGTTIGPRSREIDGCDVLINLAGRTVNCCYMKANMDEMMRSRVDSTHVIEAAICEAKQPSSVPGKRVPHCLERGSVVEIGDRAHHVGLAASGNLLANADIDTENLIDIAEPSGEEMVLSTCIGHVAGANRNVCAYQEFTAQTTDNLWVFERRHVKGADLRKS